MARRQNKLVQNSYPKKLYHFVCEDKESAVHYLAGIKRKYAKHIVVNIEHSAKGTNATAVQKAAEDTRDELQKDELFDDAGYEVISCFDKDKNDIADIKEILRKNNSAGSHMQTLYNSPCYEYWLILHFQATAAEYTSSKQCIKECMRLLKDKCGKNYQDEAKFKADTKIFDVLGDKLETAIKNAQSLTFEAPENTCTTAHTVFKEMEKYYQQKERQEQK